MILSDESQRSVVANAGVLGIGPANLQSSFDDVMYSRTSGAQQRFKKGYNMVCDFCKIKGHTRENCYKIIGYPRDFKFKKKGSNNYAYNVTGEVDDSVKSSTSTNSSDARDGHMREVPHCVNATCMNSTLVAASNNCSGWIRDTGATNHVVADLNLLKKHSICKVATPKKELFSGKVKMIGKKDGGLYILSNIIDKKEVVLAATHTEHKARITEKIDTQLLHQRLGHVSSSVLKKLLRHSLATIKKIVQESDKLKSRSTACVLMGYAETQKVYVLYDLSNKVFFVNKDVVLQEEVFPFKLKSTESVPIFTYNGINLESDGVVDNSDNNLAPHLYQNTFVDMVSQEQEENCEVEVHEEGQTEPVPQTGVRKSGRGTKPPLWMKDFVSLNIHEGPYSLDKYVSYNNIAPTYQTYLAKMSNETEPQSYREASFDPRWTKAMNAEIKALQENHTWEVVELP
ncbi:hypothetical protein KY285_032484 [Solanum tuberosum]|nr:hypothetical protein KY285_032484 [Solanum tuberosum]